MNYKCPLCAFSSVSLTAYTDHFKFHRNVANFEFPCGVSQCAQTFRTFSSLKSHVCRYHHFRKDAKAAKFTHTASLECQVLLCNFKCHILAQFLKHLKHHPFRNCNKTFSVKSSFTAHLCRNHRDFSINLLSDLVCKDYMEHFEDDEPDSVHDCESQEEVENCDEGNLLINAVDKDQYLHSLALFYLKLQAKTLLPASTIQDIIDEFQQIHSVGQSNLCSKLQERLLSLNVSEPVVEQIIKEVVTEDLLHACNSVLKTDQTRRTFFKSHVNYVEPQELYLGEDVNGKSRFCQYIPIKSSLQALFKHHSVQKQYHETCTLSHVDGVFEDISDGKAFLTNDLFQAFPSSLSLILYQDAFEVVNPLGSGKKKHKILAVYFTLANLLRHSRSNIDHMQLALLCREQDFKAFGHKSVFFPYG